jgi:hypothetical protein
MKETSIKRESRIRNKYSPQFKDQALEHAAKAGVGQKI